MIALIHLGLSIKDFIYDPKNQLLWQIVNFVVFVAILVYLLRNKIGIGKVFNDRAASIRKELDKAKIEKAEAERKLAEVEARLSKLDEEVALMREDAEREAEREATRIREAAAQEAEKIRQMTAREIAGALKEARAELRAFVAENSVAMAEAIIKRELKPEDNRRLLSKYVDELREVAK
ncbi:MAG: ATP synthase F0 subunit B [Acidobacteria bacterium]|nr:ATP synthase F0 subunit B [Acidobacteriota bacterium]